MISYWCLLLKLTVHVLIVQVIITNDWSTCIHKFMMCSFNNISIMVIIGYVPLCFYISIAFSLIAFVNICSDVTFPSVES